MSTTKMEDNPSYGMAQRNYTVQQPAAENVYELVASGTTNKREYVGQVESPVFVPGERRSKTRRSPRVCIAIIALTAVLALLVAIAGVVLNPVLNSKQEVERLQLSLNQTITTIDELRDQISTLQVNSQTQYSNLHQTVEEVRAELLQRLSPGSMNKPVSSCSDILLDSPSGEYWIQNNINSPVQVYCDMNRTCCNYTGGWTRVANLDMTDPNQQCPDGFRLVTRTTAPLRTCGRPGNFIGCVSTTFPAHGIEYSNVCGRVIGYQFGSTEGFDSSPTIAINDTFLEGVSLTHGQSPKQHIWAFAATPSETFSNLFACPCTRSDVEYTGTIPPFIGQDYFCDTGSRDTVQFIFFPDDPLWDGQGCGSTSTCCSFNNPPWFCKQLPQPTTDDIELRLCGDQASNNEDTPLEIVEVYIK